MTNDQVNVARIAELEREVAYLRAQNARLEQLCEDTYVAKGADAYNYACEQMEEFQRKRLAQGKEAGCQGSLCDGMAWLYDRLEELEGEVE